MQFKDDSTQESKKEECIKKQKIQILKPIVTFNYMKEKKKFTKKEWNIIQNNMKKNIIVSQNK